MLYNNIQNNENQFMFKNKILVHPEFDVYEEQAPKIHILLTISSCFGIPCSATLITLIFLIYSSKHNSLVIKMICAFLLSLR